MAKYPAWGVGTDVSATNLALCVPDIYTKASALSRVNNTLSNDPELVSIPLGVGTWHIKLLLFWCTDTSATPDFKTRWVITTGTWNNPLRARFGPGSGNTAAPNAVTPLQCGPTAAGSDAVYGTAAGTTFYNATEESYNVVVTVAGTLSLQWAQNTTDATNTTIQAGTTFELRQIAA